MLRRCPFCEKVILALEEKGIEYDCVLIALRDKPAWYKRKVPTGQVWRCAALACSRPSAAD